MQISLRQTTSFLSFLFYSIYLDVLLHHIIILFQFWEEPYITLHSRCTIFLPINRAKSLQFLHIIANTYSFLFHVSHLMIVKYEHFLICLLAICRSSLEKCLQVI